VSATFRRNLLLVLKEALHNIVKHSQATRVTVQLEIGERELHLEIADNGLGFDQSCPRRGGNGFGNMERRIRDLGGRFELSSQAGEGVCIDCRIPILN